MIDYWLIIDKKNKHFFRVDKVFQSRNQSDHEWKQVMKASYIKFTHPNIKFTHPISNLHTQLSN